MGGQSRQRRPLRNFGGLFLLFLVCLAPAIMTTRSNRLELFVGHSQPTMLISRTDSPENTNAISPMRAINNANII